jgi:hypothetical protein
VRAALCALLEDGGVAPSRDVEALFTTQAPL